MPRAYWTGHLRLSLVSIGVELYTAVSGARRIQLHQIHAPSGRRVRHQKVAAGVGPIDQDEIVKGYEVSRDEYVLVSPDELDGIKLESRNTIDLVQFVEHCEIDPRYFEKPYYVLPQDDRVAQEGFCVIRDALARAKRVGLGQMAVRGRDYVCAIRPCGKGLLLDTLRYADELRRSDPFFEQVPDFEPDAEMLDLAQELIERKTARFEAEAFHSQYAEALRELVEEKRRTGALSRTSEGETPAPSSREVVDLMAALERSVARDRARGDRGSRSRAGRAKSSSSERTRSQGGSNKPARGKSRSSKRSA